VGFRYHILCKLLTNLKYFFWLELTYWHIVQDRVVRGNSPTAVESNIRYLLSGPLSPHNNVEALCVGISPLQETTDTNQFWDVEPTGTIDNISKSISFLVNDQCIADYIGSSVHHQIDGSYIVQFPWKPTVITLICHQTMAFVRNELDLW